MSSVEPVKHRNRGHDRCSCGVKDCPDVPAWVEFVVYRPPDCHYNLRKLPAWRKFVQDEPVGPTRDPAWSGTGDPPAIGTKLNLGSHFGVDATVIGYFVEYGFLGCECKLAKPPAWWRKQNGRRLIARLFGVEIERL